MPRAVPRDIVKTDRLFVIPVAITTEFQCGKGRRLTHMVCDHLIECSRQWPSGPLNGMTASVTQESRCALSMNVRPLLKGAIHPRNQVDLILHLIQWLHRGQCEVLCLFQTVLVLKLDGRRRVSDVEEVSERTSEIIDVHRLKLDEWSPRRPSSLCPVQV